MKGYKILFIAALIIGLSFIGCSQSEIPRLNVYNWANYIGKNTISDFEKEFGVKVTYDNFSNNEELLAKLQGGAKGYDIIVPSDYMVRILLHQGLLQKLDHSKLPNIINVDPSFSNPEYDPLMAHCIPYHWGTAGLAVNTKFVKEPVTSWKILWDEKYRGRISILDDSRAGLNPAFGVLGLPINSKDPNHIRKARDKMIEQKPLTKVYTSDVYPDLLRSEEIWIAQGYTGDVYQVASEKPEIRYIIPEEGTELAVDSLCIPKTAQNPDMAHIFINYVLRAEVAASISNDIHYPSTNRAAKPFINREILMDPSIYPPKEVMSRLYVQGDIGDISAEYDRAWSELKAH